MSHQFAIYELETIAKNTVRPLLSAYICALDNYKEVIRLIFLEDFEMFFSDFNFNRKEFASLHDLHVHCTCGCIIIISQANAFLCTCTCTCM